jgi:serine/threonine protein kinase
MVQTVLDAVEAAHLSGVTHRDLKPQNILCDSGTSTIVIADFRVASFEEGDLYTAVETRQAERLAPFLAGHAAAPRVGDRASTGLNDLRSIAQAARSCLRQIPMQLGLHR